MDQLNELIARCKCEVHVSVNSHRNYYMTVEEHLTNLQELSFPDGLEIEPEVRSKMIELDTVVNVQFYPQTPIGSYDIYHYDLEAALTEALAILNNAHS
jgi:hypothetical protein